MGRSAKKVSIIMLQILILFFGIYGLWITVELYTFGSVRIDDFVNIAKSIALLFGAISGLFGVSIAAMVFDQWKERAQYTYHCELIRNIRSLFKQVEAQFSDVVDPLSIGHKPDEIDNKSIKFLENIELLILEMKELEIVKPDIQVNFLMVKVKTNLKQIINKNNRGELEGKDVEKLNEIKESVQSFDTAREIITRLSSQYN